MEIEFVKHYRFAHNGVKVVEYTKGQVVDTSGLSDGARLCQVAFADKVAVESAKAKADAKAAEEKAEADAKAAEDKAKADAKAAEDKAKADAKADSKGRK